MRTLALTLAAAATLALAACSNPCRDLGERLCNCTPAGTTKASCKQAVKTEVSNLNPGKDVEAVCSKALDSCYARDGIEFCDWINGRCGKASCMISEEDYSALSDPAQYPDPSDPTGTTAICPK
jgi:hypothetical protein